MKFKIFLLILAAAMVGLACCSENSADTDDHSFIGTWTEVKYEDSIRILEKNNQLIEEKRGYIFREDGMMVERSQASFCGRPGYYKNYDGAWERIGDKMLDVRVGCWDGETQYKLELIYVRSDEMKVVRHKE